jgi:hypothetical protein
VVQFTGLIPYVGEDEDEELYLEDIAELSIHIVFALQRSKEGRGSG